MSGHEFEKQVRQKLNDLKMSPSANAWESIEDKLRERKRRPVVFYWLPSLLAGLGALGYFMMDNLNENSTISNKNSTYKSTESKSDLEISSGAAKRHVPGTPAGQSHNLNKEKLSASPDLPVKNSNTGSDRQAVSNGKTFATLETGSTKSPHRISSLKLTDKVTKIETGSLENSAPANRVAFNQKFLSPSENITLKNANRLSSSALQQKKSNVSKSNKWLYGLTGFAGVSAVNEGKFLNFSQPQVEDVSTVAPFAPLPPYKPSTITPGFTFSAGAFAKRELNKKFSLSLGLNYLQVNTQNKVGNEVYGNYVVNNGSRGYIFVSNYFMVERDQQSDYRNRYHFIEVPLELHARVNKSQKLPIRANAGIAVSQLLKSNSLHFDGTSGVYYRNDKLLNQTQFAVRTGMSVELFNKTKRPIWVGPSARYNISRVLQKDVSTNKNFMSFGLDVKLFIK